MNFKDYKIGSYFYLSFWQLNVPLELSGLEHSPLDLSAAGEYRDQGLLHSLGDPWLDLRVVTSSSGAICICHHYMYKVG